MTIDYLAARNILVAVKGHAYAHDAFREMLDAVAASRADLTFTIVEQPAVDALIEARALGRFAAIIFYDMPGIATGGAEPLTNLEPSDALKSGFEALLTQGMPLLFLHHAIASWPGWPRFARIVGGRYLFQPRMIDGVAIPDSGYRHDQTHRVTPVTAHPVTAGIEDGFTLEDELYLYDVFDTDVTPLMISDHAYVAANFHSSEHAVHGRMFDNDGWDRAPGCPLFAWARREGASDILYVQGGHGPPAYANPGYRTLIGNAVDWLTRGVTPAAATL